MRRWTTGVAVVCSAHNGQRHGMTVNSFVSISMNPPLFTVTLNQKTRTWELLRSSGLLTVSILSREQQAAADRFAGRSGEEEDRFHGFRVQTSPLGLPWLNGALAALEARVVHEHALPESTLFIAEVVHVLHLDEGSQPLVYLNRGYHHLAD